MGERKNGMYGEMPKVYIGKYSICQMSDKEGETKLWLEETDEEGMEIDSKYLEPVIEKFFNKYF